MPAVSVIMPTFNRATYLDQAIRSVLDQAFADLELIVVDDGSVDGTANVIEKFQDDRLRYVRQDHEGRSVARNRGMQAANGAFVAFLDDDDRLLPEKLEKQVALMKSRSELGLIACGARLIDENDRFVENWTPWDRAPDLAFETCILDCPLMPSVVLLRRSWLDWGFEFNPELPPAEDTDFFLRLMLAGCRMAWQKEFLCEHRIHMGSSQGDPGAYAQSRQLMLRRLLTHPGFPSGLRQREDELKSHYALYSAAQCYVAGQYDIGKSFVKRALPLMGEAKLKDGPRLDEFILAAAGRPEYAEPYDAVRNALAILDIDSPQLVPERRHVLASAAQMSFYRGHQRRERGQVLRSFVRATIRRPTWLANRGTWSILLKALTNLNSSAHVATSNIPADKLSSEPAQS